MTMDLKMFSLDTEDLLISIYEFVISQIIIKQTEYKMLFDLHLLLYCLIDIILIIFFVICKARNIYI